MKSKDNGSSNSGSKRQEKSHRYSAKRSSLSSSTKAQQQQKFKNVMAIGIESFEVPKELSNDKKFDNNDKTLVTPDEEKTVDVNEDSLEQLEAQRSLAIECKEAVLEKVQFRKRLRQKNIEAPDKYPEESFFKKLDSSMKKNTSFVKKLRNMTEQQRDSLENEFNGLNLTKYIQEAVTAIVDAKLKVSDVNCAALVCSLFHQRYHEFTPLLKKVLMKNFDAINCKDEEKTLNVSKLRSSCRLLAELILDGVFINLDEGVQILINVVRSIVNCDMTLHIYAPVILSFVRHCGEDLAGIMPRKQRVWKEKFDIEFAEYDVISKESQSIFKDLFKAYYDSMAKRLVVDHKSLQNRERQNRQTIGLKGELSADRKEAFEKAQKTYEKLLSNTTSLAEIIDEEVPDLPEDEFEEKYEGGTSINIFTPLRGNEYDSENGLWEDEDTRTFYENLKDLKSVVPQILFKEKDTKPPQKDTKKDQKKKRKLRNDLNIDDDTMDEFSDDDLDDDFETDILGDDIEDNEQTNNSSGLSMAQIVEQFMQNLLNCVNRDFIDQAAETFIMKMNRKSNRKKLVRNLYTVSRTRLDLLPFYARLVATLAPCLPDVAQDLVYLLKGDFKFHLRKKHQINLESKVKNVRFIGELTKFKVCPKAEALHCLKLLLEDFTHHYIEMACHLLETCGRFLYRSPESHPRMCKLLEQMMRKKTVQTIDSRLSTMVENAFYYCNPPERPKVQEKVRPPMNEYIRKLLYKDLSKTTIEKVLRQMRKLPWDDQEEDVGVYLIDEVLEIIRLGMEVNNPKENQRRISTVKYLGELFNYQLVESDVIFSTLYSLITFGTGSDGVSSELDPPAHLFRIRLVCILLDTCGQYFDRGISKKKLDCFLVYFQCYIWRKKESGFWNENCPFPKDLDYMVSDIMESLRPKMAMYSTAEEAYDAASQLQKECQEKLDNVLSVQGNSKPESLPKDPALVPLPVSDISGTSLGDSIYSISPSFRSQSTSGDEEGDESDYLSGEDFVEDQNDAQDSNIFMMDAEDTDVKLKEAPRLIDSVDDTEFCSAFDKMITDSFQGRLNESMKSVDIPIPMHLKGKGKKQQVEDKTESVKFVLMLKKGNKQQLKDLDIPVTEDLAANIRDKQLAEREEHEEMKRLVLDYNQRQEEEAFNEMIATTQQLHRSLPYGQPSRGQRRNQQRLRSRDHDPSFFSSSHR
eukprot:gene6104-6808_t